MRGSLVALLVASSLLAGCSDGGGDPAAEPAQEPDAFQDIDVTATTGAIRGLVITEAIVPIPGATVRLVQGGQEKVTDDDGAFVFTGLEPGTYFLSVSKVGHFTVQTSAEVVAGVENPPIVKVVLVVDEATQPFTEMLQWSGFFACGVGTNAGGGIGVNPCAVDAIVCGQSGICLLGSSNTHDFPFGTDRVPDLAQAEAVWEGTQALGNDLYLGWHESGTADFTGVGGPSPLVLPATKEQIVDAHGENTTSLLARIFPGDSSPLTVTLQQRFDVFVTYFYGFVPREGWAFVVDGACTSPEQCT